jgi:glycosyltransferase involved in cell wall biosynthesis
MLSFVIPAYNEEKIIAATLQRLRRELTSIPYEIIVTDDGSTDNTVAAAGPHADRVVTCPPPGQKSTIAANRNRGAAVARYPYIVSLDSDSIIPQPNQFFQLALSRFREDPRLVGLTGQLYVDPAAATTADKFFCFFINGWVRFANIIGCGLSQGKFQMISREAFNKVGGFSEQLAVYEDNDLFTKLARIGRTRFEPRLITYYSGRRAHAIGWPRQLYLWIKNAVSAILFQKAADSEWKPYR